MSTKSKFLNGILTFFEGTSHERVLPLAPVVFYDDFLGNALNTTSWGARDTAGGTEGMLANSGNGVLALALSSTNEVQLAGVDWANQRTLVLNQGLIFEARIRLSVLPTGAVIACIGLCGDHNAAVDTVAESIWFRADGGGAITVEHDDTANESTKVATGKTVTAVDWLIVRIDCTDIASVKFFVNGDQVAAGTKFDMSTVAGLALQPVARIGKEGAATSVGTLLVDYVRAWQARS
ncbi:MAG: hypothetical protein WDM91_10930 [Rhizomicrobium sp.]